MGLPFGSFSHYGATGPPYWAFAYPLAPWLANNTVGQVGKDMPAFRQRYCRGADPSLIIVGSGFWDLASWWAHEGNFSKSYEVRFPCLAVARLNPSPCLARRMVACL